LKNILLAAIAAAAFACQPARALDSGSEESLYGECLLAAASVHRVPPGLLVLLLNVENGSLGKVSPNKNRTVDIGPMQVNDAWVQKVAAHWGSTRQVAYAALRDNFCANIEGGAWILRQALDEAHGDLWEGVALYHSHTESHKIEYLRLVFHQALRLHRQAAAELSAADAITGR
jgi:hypothetical protein